jgi:hypothetical protein
MTRTAGILALWNDCRPGAEAEYEAWYRGEHLRERVGLPGFNYAHRYTALAGTAPRYFTFYETETPEVLTSPVYLERGANPTPMTRHIMEGVYQNMSRTVCQRDRQHGDIQGAFAVTVRASADHVSRLDRAWPQHLALDHLLRAELWSSIEPPDTEPSVEERIRGRDAKIAACFMASFSDADHATAAIGTINRILQGESNRALMIGGYRLLCSLQQKEIAP